MLTSEPIAFSAASVRGGTYDTNVTIPFSIILSNFVDHYDNQTSTFTCPHHGVYLFFVNIITDDDNDQMEAELVVNYQTIITTFADGIDQAMYQVVFQQAWNNVLTECFPGDNIWVRSGADGNQLAGQANANTFSGLLLSRLS